MGIEYVLFNGTNGTWHTWNAQTSLYLLFFSQMRTLWSFACG